MMDIPVLILAVAAQLGSLRRSLYLDVASCQFGPSITQARPPLSDAC